MDAFIYDDGYYAMYNRMFVCSIKEKDIEEDIIKASSSTPNLLGKGEK